ncbi:unnamed protein product [Cercopithifilaria johnstoni]|uniref:Uncharacterized protein n=1 Tax=Cercopithifilaria johnstoni TaxID=2874296 RepID=A0A8J2Q7P9_9BILA|nr:unnamed protein product [Cercopithifilaria johnstoni]
MLTNPETDVLQQQLLSIKKRAGARAFGSLRTNDFDNLFYPNNKRHQAFSPFYYYQQPKRGGGHPFYTYWSPSDVKFIENFPYFKKRSLRDSDDYIY